MPRSVRSATRVICVSEATAADVREPLGRRARDGDRQRRGRRFAPGDAEAERRWARGRSASSAPFVLHVGSLEPRKGLGRADRRGGREPPAGSWCWPAGRATRASGSCAPRGPRAPPGRGRRATRRWRASTGPPRSWPCRRCTRASGSSPLEAMASGTPVVVAADAGALGELAATRRCRCASARARRGPRRSRRHARRRGELVRTGLERAARHRWPQVAAAVRGVLAAARRR